MAGIPGTVGGALAMNAGCFGGEAWSYVSKVEVINSRGEIKLRSPAEFEISYRHVKRPADEWFVAGYFNLKMGQKAQALATIKNLLTKRNQTQPTGAANCGSVFRNPPGDYAGRLIESCHLKGRNLGGAQVSEKHANFILNTHHATASDIENLIIHVQETVKAEQGVLLMPEVCIIGKRN
jgi:UDP-N-acetylmuramate dehydrogenase